MKYKIELEIAGKVYKAEGSSFVSALNKIKPSKVTYKGYIKARYGNNKIEKVLPIWFMRKLFGEHGKMQREVMQKNILVLMGIHKIG